MAMQRGYTLVLTCLVALLCFPFCSGTAQCMPVQWSTQTYGPDGPWQAVKVMVGGFDNNLTPSSQETSVDLIPGATWTSQILSPNICQMSNATADCGLGGTWDPETADGGIESNQTQNGQFIAWPYNSNGAAPQLNYAEGASYLQYTSLNYDSNYQGADIPNSSLVSLSTGTMSWPSGKVTSMEVGALSLGALSSQQVFAESTTTKLPSPSGWMVPWYLYNQSITPSASFGLQIGTTVFNYTGSLVFGGYDSGRVIGPLLNYQTSSPANLKDIVIGVETGGSPFSFTNKSGLLLDENNQQNTVHAYPEFLTSYMWLPGPTCTALAQNLPVYFDKTSSYYLWNTSDPSYHATVTSAAYLGFVFLQSDYSEVTIKVPMSYLNLTLETSASGLDNDVAYFPCQPYTPSGGTSYGYFGSGGDSYALGRAFLQAAFFGRNWAQGTNWLAQAPGPGANGDGLGFQPTDIQYSDNEIAVSNDTNAFNATMQGFWKPLPMGKDQTSSGGNGSVSTSGPIPTHHGSGGLSGGADAGIAIGAVAAVAVLLGAFWFLRRQRKRKAEDPAHAVAASPEERQPMAEAAPAAHYGNDAVIHELSPHNEPRNELQGAPVQAELPASGPDKPSYGDRYQ